MEWRQCSLLFLTFKDQEPISESYYQFQNQSDIFGRKTPSLLALKSPFELPEGLSQKMWQSIPIQIIIGD